MLCAFEIVRELNEGVKRIYHEMQSMGLPAPEFVETEHNFKVILRNNIASRISHPSSESVEKSAEKKLKTAEKQIKKLKDAGDICRDGGDNGGKWIVLKNVIL